MAMKIVVVGHYSNAFSTVREALSGNACEVRALDHDGALAGQLTLDRPDLVILDVGSYDGEAGWDLLVRLTSGSLPARTPIIVFANHVHDVQDHRASLTDQVAAVLIDPCTEEDVRYCVRAALPSAGMPARGTGRTSLPSTEWSGYEVEEVTVLH